MARDKKAVYYRLEIDTLLCTLCPICASRCEKGAISQKMDNSIIYLYFENKLCDGCKVCERLCPESALKVVSTHQMGVKSILLNSGDVAVCEECNQPFASLKHLERAYDKSKTLLSARRRLCPICRINRLLSSVEMP
ncbi:MAG: hypothetical protein QXJ17_08910 [Nitrososphaeria archaeon]